MSETIPTPTAPLLLNKSLLVELTSDGPTLHDAAAELLRQALKKTFPDQQIDPDKTMLMSPIWRQRGEEFITHSSHFESLTHALARQAFTQELANYIEGEHFLTLTPRSPEPIHLPISMDAITTLLNEHAPMLFKGFEQSQLDYWNETTEKQPRWQVLSDTLKEALNIQSVNGWDAHECTLARLISQHPDKALRPTSDSGLANIRACLLDVDLAFELAEASRTRHLMLSGALVLTATLGSRELIVMYTLSNGYETFSSMAQLGAVLPARIDIDLSGQSLKWRLYEPEGNIFDATVWALVGCQLDSIDALDPASRSPLVGLMSRQATSATLSVADKARVEQLDDAIPEWLLKSSLDDIQTYSSYLTDLGSLRGEANSDVFNVSEIPLIHAYAQQKICAAIVTDRPGEDATTLRLDDIRITITHSFEAGGFTLPDPHNRSVETLAEFALQNTRPYSATVAYADGTAAPAWMTVTFLLRMANQVNVGETYPQLIKRTLIDDPMQALRHKARYCRQLPLLLPLLALECKLQRRGDVDEQGYRQVRQLMESIEKKSPTREWPVHIRPLAFMPRYRLGNTPDTVANTYIIGPSEGQNGPCLLYQPLLDQPLRQFPSEQNMLYAFYQPGELRDSILAWLPDRALSFDYAQYVFSSGIPSPWTITELAFEPFIHLDLSASIELANTPLDGNILATLFQHNSQAMAELADRQSTSNAERRWTLLADSGWAMFSVAANFLSGSAGTAVWVWQSIHQIQQALDANERGNTAVQWSSIGDVLLTLGILLTQRVATRRIWLSSPFHESAVAKGLLKEEPPFIAPPSTKAPTVTHETTPLSAELPTTHLSTLTPATLGRINAGAQFSRQINRFQVPAPNLPEGAGPNANHLHEFEGKLFAKVGERWFQVSAETDEPVFIVDPTDPSRSGFGVKYDAGEHRWHWDLKLRLRGGGPTGRIEALRREKARKKDDAWAALHRFIELETTRKASLDEALKPLDNNDPLTTMSEEAIATYIAKSDELASGYGQALDDLEKWREAGGAGVFYQSQLMRLTVELHRYLSGWMRMKLREYAKIVAPQFSPSEPPETRARAVQMAAAQKAIAVSDEMIDRLGRLQASLDRLMSHTGTTRKVADDLRRLLPSFSHYDFEANEIGMSTELCLREVPGSDMGQIRQRVVESFDNAADAGHTLIEQRTKRPADTPALGIEQLTALVDRLADTERRLQDLSISSHDQLEPVRFKRVQALVGKFHQLARSRLLKLLPETEEIPVAAMARLEPVPSTSRAIGKVSKSRPRVVKVEKTPSTETEVRDAVPIVKMANRRPVQSTTSDDASIVANGLALNSELDAFIQRTRSDAQRPSRIPADMKDLFDQRANRLEQAAEEVDAVLTRRGAEFPVASLTSELREGAARARREGISVYGAMLMGRKPRETYLKWLSDHDQVEIVKDERGRIKTQQRRDYFQEYRILDKTRQNKVVWVAHFHYDHLTDAGDKPTAAHLKLADAYLQELPATTREEMSTFDAVDNALRRITDPAVRDLFLALEPKAPIRR
ncbi:dermonecrotic toxin domain-containing protein [Pseudomonas sp. NPDC086251]|uniref:dermonecrotic toxin domain-containing protein n=1 Tax=Pseudomonas sp. NPDC086251 TaxID=3364431 RepID=UPI0038395439